MQGDNRVEKYMHPISEAISRHMGNGDASTDIYNRAYGAVYQAIKDHEASPISTEQPSNAQQLDKQKVLDWLKEEIESCNVVGNESDKSIRWECERLEKRINAGMFDSTPLPRTVPDMSKLTEWEHKALVWMTRGYETDYLIDVIKHMKHLSQGTEETK